MIFLPVFLRGELILSISFETNSQVSVTKLPSLSQRYLDLTSGISKPYFSLVKLWFESTEKLKLSLFDRISTELVATLFRLDIHFQISA